MCHWTQREYGCGHNCHIAAYWCNSYRLHKRRCPTEIAYYEYRTSELCFRCRPRQVTPQHASYLKSIYKDLCQRYPSRNWEYILLLADPDRKNLTEGHSMGNNNTRPLS
ncbi:hypothetical protein SPI_09361 [Niveomyces insectorum RCEF 264]|uniref:Uncharacterized protein n=1 Tax=Niveomyces insectorum RCEF 264 TaxID=1081102 RepID=A0A167LXS7_9HYPO|nr:hypothetical protein SPI_09361 [Niveomyces insectorum RCEF 264]